MSIEDGNSIKTFTICNPEQNIDPTSEKGDEAKYLDQDIYERKLNWMEGLFEIAHKTDYRLDTFLNTVKKFIHIVGYLIDVSLGSIRFLM